MLQVVTDCTEKVRRQGDQVPEEVGPPASWDPRVPTWLFVTTRPLGHHPAARSQLPADSLHDATGQHKARARAGRHGARGRLGFGHQQAALPWSVAQEVRTTRKVYLGGTLTWFWLPCGFLTSVWAPTNVTQRQNLLPN